MKNKLDKYVARAFDEAGVVQPDDCKTVSDLELWIANLKAATEKYKEIAEKCKDNIESNTEDLELLESVKHQIKIERYKELNPNAQVI